MAEPAAAAAVRAVTSPRPSHRYLVGYDAQLAGLYSRAVPEAVRDRLSRLALGL